MGAILLSVIFVDSVQGERLKVSVTSSAGNSVFLDAGRAAGLEPGHRVKLFPPGGAPVDGVVRAVTSNSARVDFPPGLALPPVGTKGEVDVEEREEPAPDKTDESKKKKTPEHPPWKRKEGKRDPNAPLLAPAFSRRPEERKPTIRGRVFTQATYTQDNGEDRDNSFLDARAGLWLELKNLFGKGGRLLFDGEIEFEHSDVPGGNESDTTVHIDRLSYAIGGEDYAPWRAEAGRF